MTKLTLTTIVPAYNAANTIADCLEALLAQQLDYPFEIIVADDGSNDATAAIVRSYIPQGVQLLQLAHRGAGAARNAGIEVAKGELLLFTDADCVPAPDWAVSFAKTFEAEPELAAAKGVYRTWQAGAVARFVQAEYADRYRRLAQTDRIDFIDTYSAAYRREVLQHEKFDPRFPGAIVEDAELAYRLTARGFYLKFVPEAVVYHRHANSVQKYFRRKFKIGFWRVAVYRQHPTRLKGDTHTPQVAKVQMLLVAGGVGLASLELLSKRAGNQKAWRTSLLTALAFWLTTWPFSWRTWQTDKLAATIAPFMLLVRAVALATGALGGLVRLLVVPIFATGL